MASMPTATLEPRYSEVWSREDSFSKILLSRAKVEKVVNPPQKPVASRSV